VAEEDEQDEAVPEGCSPKYKRRQRGDATMAKSDGGLNSDARAEEGENELESEGERCGVLRGWSSPFIGVEGASGRQQRAVTHGG
jgi:hypothetical protein